MIKKTKDYNFEEEMKYLSNEKEKILSMSELRNGNLLILQKTQFKILEIDDDGHPYTIQTKKADDSTNFIQLIFNYLILRNNPPIHNKLSKLSPLKTIGKIDKLREDYF